jgi:glutamate-5-semialdehyde dehydrogenase
VYIDEASDLETAIRVVLDGKTNYPAACNATEKVLIHKSVVSSHLIPVIQTLLKNGVSARVDQFCLDVLTSAGADISKFIIQQTSGTDGPSITLATDEDFITEFLDLVIAVKVVDSLQDAISHINYYGSHHTDCIVTTNDEAGEVFMQQVDSAGVYKNASTRFADGFRYGFGAEVCFPWLIL